MKRRTFVISGLGLIGTGALTYGGSLVGCAVRGDVTAMFDPLFIAIEDVRAPDRIGQAWAAQEPLEEAAKALLSQRPIMTALLTADDGGRLDLVRRMIRLDFSCGAVVLADRWVVAKTEARIASAWVQRDLS